MFKRLLGSALGLALMLGLAVSLQAAELVQAPVAAAVSKSSASSSSASAKVKLPKKCRTAKRALCADKTKRKLYYVEKGKIKKTTDARFGCAGSRHTRNGTFKVYRKNKHWVSTIYHTAMPYSMFFSGGQAVHYSADFAARGYYGCSHGCVNIRNMTKLKWIYSRIHVGDRVVVYYS